MGKSIPSKQNEEPKASLVEILYSDNDIISSLDSQYRSGTEEHRALTNESQSESIGSIGISAILKGSVEHNDRLTKGILRTISPYDSKVMQLISDLDLSISSETVSTNQGKIVLLNGAVRFFKAGSLLELLNNSDTMGIIESTKKVFSGNDYPDFMQGKSILQFMKEVMDFLPKDPFILLQLKNNKRQFCLPVNSEYLRQSSDTLHNLYGCKICGNWTVAGILNPTTTTYQKTNADKSLISNMITVYDSLGDLLSTAGIPNETIIPFLIYRNLEY